MVLHVVRVLFILIVGATASSYAFQLLNQPAGAEGGKPPAAYYVYAYIVVPALLATGLVLIDMFWRRKPLAALSGLFFGLVAGMLIAWGLTYVIDMIVAVYPALHDEPLVKLIKAVVGASAVFLCISVVLQTKDDFRFVIPYVEFSRQTKGTQPLLLDTSAIIDGRIADIAETRIFDAEMIVPRFILGELQGIADSDNKLKRNRGRRGLDVLNRLRSSDKLDIRILDVTMPGVRELKEADAKLVALAGHLDARVVTNDYNLNKVARLHDVTVININDLANALKPVVLPGESMRVKVVKPGEEPGQGVGYLDDGTMVVVEKGREKIGEEVEIAVTSVLQTSAGRMIFGQRKNG